MNGNRGQYTSAPLYNMKKRRVSPPPAQQTEETSASFSGQTARSKRYFPLSLIACLGLPLLFLTALIVPNNILRLVFLAAAALTVLAMWILKAFAKSARGTLTVVYCALALVIGLALFMNSQSPEARSASAPSRQDLSAAFTNNDPSAFGAVLSNYTTPQPQENSNSAAAAAAVSAAQQQLEGFLEAWALGDVPRMLDYVLPSWKTQQTSPETALWQLTLDSRPVQYQFENVLGSDGDTTRTIVLRVSLNERNAGSEPVLKRMMVIMFRSGQTWYVDPQSLNGTNIDVEAEAAQMNMPIIATTIAPTASPAPVTATSGITLYYNPDGGKYYHAKSTCEAVSQNYWPLTGFSFDLLNSAQFNKLRPCPKCNPPTAN